MREDLVEMLELAACWGEAVACAACDGKCEDHEVASASFDGTKILAAIEAAGYTIEPGWQPIETAPKGEVIDVWLGDAEPEDVDFYCTEGTRRSPGWHWVQGKWRPVNGLPPMTVFVQPTHGRPLPAAPKAKP
jgi:hypothetical protein